MSTLSALNTRAHRSIRSRSDGGVVFSDVSLASLLLVLGCAVLGCGDGSGGGGSAVTAPVSFGVSDAPVEGLLSVVVTIDRIILDRDGNDDFIIDRFTNEGLGLFNEDTITIDLLDYQGEDNLLIVGPLKLDVAEYQGLRLEILDNDIRRSHVQEMGGEIRPIIVPSGQLNLGRFEVSSRGDQTFILEFGLRKAITYNPGPDRYILKPRGIRIIEVSQGTMITGVVDANLFDGAPPCDGKIDDPYDGNVMYLYRGRGLDSSTLADDFDPDLDPDAAAELIEPFASEAVGVDGNYVFAYLPAGDYTLAFSCDAIDDDPDFDEGFVVPTPNDQIIEITTRPGESWTCDFDEVLNGQCARVRPAQPPPPPPPTPPSGGACSVQPNLNPGNIIGGPFLDCGYSDSTRVPNPTAMRHALQSMSQQTTCITPDFTPATWAFPNLPEIEIHNSDQEYHNSGTFPGDVIFTGQRVKFINTQGGRVVGNPVCGPGARHIEYDGNCLCN